MSRPTLPRLVLRRVCLVLLLAAPFGFSACTAYEQPVRVQNSQDPVKPKTCPRGQYDC